LRPDGDYGPETAAAVAAYFRDRRLPPPDGIHQRPASPETLSFLLEALAAGGESEEVSNITTGVVGGDECKRGVNLVPIYIEIDPERAIPNENRTNNRVQFTVSIDCSNVAK
jgi:peptidoglycan hydrolase-like protein with peptidoglycan-binding domain